MQRRDFNCGLGRDAYVDTSSYGSYGSTRVATKEDCAITERKARASGGGCLSKTKELIQQGAQD